jgi:hypothetical protein
LTAPPSLVYKQATTMERGPHLRKEVPVSQKFAQEALLKALESRFDYSSARTILKRLLKACGLTDGQELSAEEVALVAERFAAIEPKADRVIARLRDLSGGAAPAPKALAAKAPAVVEEAPAVVEEAPAAVEEAPAVVEEAPAVVEEAPAALAEEAEDADGDEARGEEGEGEEAGNSGGNRRGKRGRK